MSAANGAGTTPDEKTRYDGMKAELVQALSVKRALDKQLASLTSPPRRLKVAPLTMPPTTGATRTPDLQFGGDISNRDSRPQRGKHHPRLRWLSQEPEHRSAQVRSQRGRPDILQQQLDLSEGELTL